MSLYSDLLSQHYLDSNYGVISNVQGDESCDNYHLFSAEAKLVAGWDIWPQYVSFYKACEVEPGLICRYPGKESNGISQDEMIGAATLDAAAAECIYQYGQKHWWYYDVSKNGFSLSKWMGRFIDFKPYIKHAARFKLNIFQQLAWTVGTIITTFSSYDNTSSKLLKWVQLKKMEHNYYLCDLAIIFFRWKMSRQYKNGLKDVMGIYFGPNHPLAKYAPNNFE